MYRCLPRTRPAVTQCAILCPTFIQDVLPISREWFCDITLFFGILKSRMRLLKTLQQILGLGMVGDSLDRPRVCVVGAGITGLRAAGVLVEKGWDVTVLEARDRMGGRVVISTPALIAQKLSFSFTVSPVITSRSQGRSVGELLSRLRASRLLLM
jgi:hypothetical protein